MPEEILRVACILRCNQRDAAKHLERAKRDILHIPDGSGDDVETTGRRFRNGRFHGRKIRMNLQGTSLVGLTLEKPYQVGRD